MENNKSPVQDAPGGTQKGSDDSKALSYVGVLLAAFSFFFMHVYLTGNYYGSDISRTYWETVSDLFSRPIPTPYNALFVCTAVILPIVFVILCLITTFAKKRAARTFAVLSIITYIIALIIYITINTDECNSLIGAIFSSISKFPALLFIIGMIVTAKTARKD